MSLLQTETPHQPMLTPLQEMIYSFLKNGNHTLYTKDQLMVELKVTHKGSLTRSLNQLANQNLIHLISQNNEIYIELTAGDTRLASTETLRSSFTQLALLPTETEPTPSLSTPSTPGSSRTTTDSISTLETSPLTQVNPSSTEHTKILEPQPPEVLPLQANSFITHVELAHLPKVKEMTEAQPNNETKTKNAKKKEKENAAKPSVSNQTTPTQPNVTVNAAPTPVNSTPKITAPQSVAAKDSTIQVTLNPLETKFKNLNKNTKKLMRFLLKTCLDQKSWFLTNYPSHLTKEQQKSAQIPERLKALEKAGFIKLSGAKGCRLTFQQSPLELCQQLSSFKDFLTPHQKTLQMIHQAYLNELQPVKVAPTKPQDSTSTPMVVAKPVTTQPQSPKVEAPQPATVTFPKRYFLLDSENCNQFLSSTQWLNQLKPTDSFIIFLSQNSPSIKPAMFHALQQHAKHIETRFTTVRGKGESDLDHVLTMELAYLWMQDPEAQYIILSKDQGFLASVDYWTQRHQLKINQLCLKSKL